MSYLVLALTILALGLFVAWICGWDQRRKRQEWKHPATTLTVSAPFPEGEYRVLIDGEPCTIHSNSSHSWSVLRKGE